MSEMMFVLSNITEPEGFWGHIWHWITWLVRHPINSIGFLALVCWGILLFCLIISYPSSDSDRLRHIENALRGRESGLSSKDASFLFKWALRLSLLWMFMTAVYYAGYFNGQSDAEKEAAAPAPSVEAYLFSPSVAPSIAPPSTPSVAPSDITEDEDEPQKTKKELRPAIVPVEPPKP
ncbi:MAG: hypothetical protein ACI4WT_06760 [Oligosphaeraceae bacterium]